MVEEKTGQANDGIISLVAELGGTWIGCVFLKLRGEALYLCKSIIQLARKSEGIGCKVIETSIDEAKSGDRSEIELQVQVELTYKLSNLAAIGFTKSMSRPATVAAARLW